MKIESIVCAICIIAVIIAGFFIYQEADAKRTLTKKIQLELLYEEYECPEIWVFEYEGKKYLMAERSGISSVALLQILESH